MDEGVFTSNVDRYRGEDAGDLRRIELVEKWTCLNVLEKKICKLHPKILTKETSWRTWKSDQNIVMDEELVHNIVMDEELVQNVAMGGKFVKNFAMGAKIDSKVSMDKSISKINGWKSLQLSNRKLLEESIEEAAMLEFYAEKCTAYRAPPLVAPFSPRDPPDVVFQRETVAIRTQI